MVDACGLHILDFKSKNDDDKEECTMQTTTQTALRLSKSQEEALMELAYYGIRGDYDNMALSELISMGLVTVGHRRGRIELTEEGRRLHHELRTNETTACQK